MRHVAGEHQEYAFIGEVKLTLEGTKRRAICHSGGSWWDVWRSLW